jgi:signal transduction histidine kinase
MNAPAAGPMDASLRASLDRIAALEAEVAMLREANEHLVLATVNAESLREDAEAANRRQNEFLAMLAHELRNPLSPISTAASLLERTQSTSPQLLGLARIIGRQVGHMAHLLDDLLDAARISSGKITLSPEPLALAEVIRTAVETVRPRMQERNQQLALTLPPESVVVDGDRVRLTQVFTNLLNNASKYTGDGGRVRVSVEQEPDQVCVTVEDSGIGMGPDVIPHIFDLFTQGPRERGAQPGRHAWRPGAGRQRRPGPGQLLHRQPAAFGQPARPEPARGGAATRTAPTHPAGRGQSRLLRDAGRTAARRGSRGRLRRGWPQRPGGGARRTP